MLLRRFCYKCGRETEELTNGLCKECYEEEFKEVEVDLHICGKCGRIKEGKLWRSISVEEFLKSRLNAKEVDVENLIAVKKSGEKVRIKLNVLKETCTQCGKISGGYYEAVVQLRGFDEGEIERIKSFIPDYFFEKACKEGIDLYFLRKRVAEKVARKIKRVFKNVTVKKTCELVTVKDGQRVYRNYLSVRKHEEVDDRGS